MGCWVKGAPRCGIEVFLFLGRLTPRGPTIIYRHQLKTHRLLPFLKYIPWSCDHSSSDSRDRGRACGHRTYHGTFSHLLSHAPRISADFGWYIRHHVLPRLQLLVHTVRRMAFNPQLADHAAWMQLDVANRCTTSSENKPTPPPRSNKKP